MKYRSTITQDGNYVVLTTESEIDGSEITRTFMAPTHRGYVQERVNGDWRQVCDGLASTGNTLMSSRDELLADIRREHGIGRRRLATVLRSL